MTSESVRLSVHVRVDAVEGDLIIKSREETGRGKRFGIDGEITLDEREAERFARWVFAREFDR